MGIFGSRKKVLFFLLVLVPLVLFLNRRRFNGNREPTIILLWTGLFSPPGAASVWDWIQGEPGMAFRSECFCNAPENDVVVTLNRSLWDQATAIVFHASDFNRPDLPPTRIPEQIWTILELEPPSGIAGPSHKFHGFFNWTMTYRRDADVWIPYGSFVENTRIIPETDIEMEGGLSLDQWIANKNETKLILWVASNCETKSGRERLVEKLKNLPLPIDIVGKCGESKKKICRGSDRITKHCDEAAFWAQLARQYKFYFAAENRLCEDYVTEKLWRPLRLGMVPVVYGDADYSQLAPPSSVINVKDFSAPKELADFLKELANDNERYKSYFLWRSRYHVKFNDDEVYIRGFCSLCEKAFHFRKDQWTPAKSKVYYNFSHQWKFILARNGHPERPACVRPLY